MRVVVLLYGVVVYLLFFATFLYLIAFVGGEMTASVDAPKSIDWGTSPLEGAPPAVVNLLLLMLFGFQHTLMARQSFKRVWTQIVAWPVERSTFVLASTALIIALFVFWIPMPGLVWVVKSPVWRFVLTALFLGGFGLVLLATFLINHFELFGLMQVWHRFRGQPMPSPIFHTPWLYRYVRHPLYLGFMIAFWATPTMTAGHLLFAAAWTIYIFVALGYEERDLVRLFGDKYRKYMEQVPMILPIGRRKSD